MNADVLFAEAVIRGLEHPLRTPDALHLAAARRLDATLVTFDRQLATAAVSPGLRTAPA